jgi:hypothetical protein
MTELEGKDLAWVISAQTMFNELFDRTGRLEKQVEAIKDGLVRRDVRRFERTDKTGELVQKIMMGAYSHIGESEFSREDCDLLLTMLGIEERLT